MSPHVLNSLSFSTASSRSCSTKSPSPSRDPNRDQTRERRITAVAQTGPLVAIVFPKHLHLSCRLVEPIPMSVTKYYELLASRSKDLSDFRARLKLAPQKLHDIGFLKSFMVRNDIVHSGSSPS